MITFVHSKTSWANDSSMKLQDVPSQNRNATALYRQSVVGISSSFKFVCSVEFYGKNDGNGSTNVVPRSSPKNLKNPTKVLDLDVVKEKWTENSSKVVVGTVIKYLRDSESALEFFSWLKSKKFKHDLYTYNCLLNKLISLRSFREAQAVYIKMISAGFLPNGFTYAVMIQSMCQEKDAEGAHALIEEMVDKGYKPSSTLYLTVVACLNFTRKARDTCMLFENSLQRIVAVEILQKKALVIHFVNTNKVKEAYQVFTKICAAGCKPDATTLSSIIYGLCKGDCPQGEQALALFKQASSQGKLLNSKAITSLITALCKAGEMKTASEVCTSNYRLGGTDSAKDMMKRGYELMIRMCLELGRVQDAQYVFDEMVGYGELPCNMTCQNLIQAFLKNGWLGSTFDLIREMISAGYSLDVTTHTILINSLCKAGKLGQWHDYLDAMPKDASIYSYNILLNGLCKSKKVEEAFVVFSKMSRRGIFPNVVTYSIMINGLCKVNQVEHAEHLFYEMKKNGRCIPDLLTYNSLLNGLARSGRVDEAYSKLGEMVASGCIPDVITYSTLVHGFCIAKRYDEARKLFDTMLDEKCAPNVVPNVVTYNCLLHGMCKEGKLEEAKEFFDGMLCAPDNVAFTTLLDGYCSAGRMSDAVAILDDMIQKGHKPDVVAYNCLLRGFVSAGRIEDAEKLFERMEYRDSISFNAIITGMCDAKRIDDALEVFERMETDERDVGSYNAMIQGLCSENRTAQAMRLFQEMERPNNITFSILSDAL